MTQRRPVIVGVDGSAESLAAVVFGAHEARLRGTRLHLLAAAPPTGGAEARGYLDRACLTVGDTVEVSGELVPGGAAGRLIAAGDRACLLVVGHRGRGGFAGLLIGSVAAQVAEYAPCPVIVVRDGPHLHAADYPELPVCLGVDAAAGDDAACAFGFAEAALRGVELRAVYSWIGRTPGDRPPPHYDIEHDRAAETLAGCVGPWEARYPAVRVRRSAVTRPARQVLLDASGRAGLIVVGSRGVTGVRIGSVAQALIRGAQCPVAIVRRTADDPG